MTEESLHLLNAQLIDAEDMRLSAYLDPDGYLTIGIGRLIDERKGGGITRDEALYLLRNDIQRAQLLLNSYLPWWINLNEVRQRVLVEMVFNMGIGRPHVSGLMSFGDFLGFVGKGDNDSAAKALLDSEAARRLPKRYHRLAEMIRTGLDPVPQV